LVVAKLRLAAGAGVNEQVEAAAPIHGAVMGGNAEMVRLLLDHGADQDLADYKARSPRQLAIEIERPDLARLFD
jgi:ankyrin repeat protein